MKPNEICQNKQHIKYSINDIMNTEYLKLIYLEQKKSSKFGNL